MYYQINELARLTGVSVRTLRYYDEQGLLVPERLVNSHRRYSQKDYFQLRLIIELKELGLSLEQIADLLAQDSQQLQELLKLREASLLQTIKQKQTQLIDVRKLLKGEVNSLNAFEALVLDDQLFQQNPLKEELASVWGVELDAKTLQEYVVRNEVGFQEFTVHYHQLAKVAHLAIGDPHVQVLVSDYLDYLKKLYGNSINQQGLLKIAQSYQKNAKAKKYFDQYGQNFNLFLSQAMQFNLTES